MNKKSRIKLGDLSGKVSKPELKPLSDAETTKVVGGSNQTAYCPWNRPGRPGGPIRF